MPEGWKVEEGALVCRKGGDIITKEKFENFEMSIEWKISEGGNSGIMFRVQETDGRMGLTGMRERLLAVGGDVAVGNHPDHGAEVRISVPLAASALSQVTA